MTSYITFGGKERPIRFSYKAIKSISKKLKLKLTDFDKIIDSFDNIEVLAYYGLISGAEASDLEVDFTLKHIADWLDEGGMGKIQEILAIFGESQSEPEPLESESSGKKILQVP